MDIVLFCSVIAICVALLYCFLSTPKSAEVATDDQSKPRPLLGNTGLPFIGETWDFASTLRNGHAEEFVFTRMAKYSRDIFKTSIMGDQIAIICGPAGNKFLFSNGNKLVKIWRNSSILKLFLSGEMESNEQRSPLKVSFKPDGLRKTVGVIDDLAQQYLDSQWEGQGQVTVFPLIKNYTVALAFRLCLSVEDPDFVKKMVDPMKSISQGIVALPIDLPGTQLNRALKAADMLKLQISKIVRQQREEEASYVDHKDHKNLLSCYLEQDMKDRDIANGILSLLSAIDETNSMVLTMMFVFLADYPDIYRRVYEENVGVASKKSAGEHLNWEDVMKLKYTWNVAREIMRIHPPAAGMYREAMEDFTYAGYHIPKGFKLYTSAHATHKDEAYFPAPEKFDPSRFEGDGPLPYTYIPFGGGSNVCPGQNYAQAAILVFIHNALKRFRWERVLPDEKIVANPLPKPAKGFPVILHPLGQH